MSRRIVVWILAFCCTAVAAGAQVLDREMATLAGSLSKSLAAQGFKNIAAVDFTDLQGQPTELGRFLSEQLAVELVGTGGISMLDRANIKNILAEHKLTEEGLVNPANAKKLGEFAGVDAIVIGNITSLDAGIVLMVKAISTQSAKIVAAGRISFPKTSDIQQLLNRGISSAAGNTFVGSASSEPITLGYRDAGSIATKDLGALRVVLKSVLPIKITASNGTTTSAVRCTFDFINRETQRPLLVAVNSQPTNEWRKQSMGTYARGTLTEERGGLWNLPMTDVKGVGIVGVGQRELAWEWYDPAEIAPLLRLRDERNTDRWSTGDHFPFVYGTTTAIAPGQSVSVSMAFIPTQATPTRSTYGTRGSAGGGDGIAGPSKFFQLDVEIVLGSGAEGARKSYGLQNLTFDRVPMPAF